VVLAWQTLGRARAVRGDLVHSSAPCTEDTADRMALTPYGLQSIIYRVAWTVVFHDDFDEQFKAFKQALQDELLAHAKLLQDYGPNLGRPAVDTLNGSKHANMKELRFNWQKEVWRVAFAFDPKRRAVLLVAGNKAGTDEKRFYKQLIKVADERFERHLAALKPARKR
jgi:hypothetical protein